MLPAMHIAVSMEVFFLNAYEVWPFVVIYSAAWKRLQDQVDREFYTSNGSL